MFPLHRIREEFGLEHLEADGDGVADLGQVALAVPGHRFAQLVAGQQVAVGKAVTGDRLGVGVDARRCGGNQFGGDGPAALRAVVEAELVARALHG